MSSIIKYTKQFNKEFKEIIIVLSKFSELKTIDKLPIDTKILSKSKEIEKILDENQFYESYNGSQATNSLYNLKIILVKKLKSESYIEEGAKLYSRFNTQSENILNIIFSEKLLRTNNSYCSDFIFGLLLKSYSFNKYKTKHENFLIHSINICCSKNFKIKKLTFSENLLKAINFTKDLVSEPANNLNPKKYADLCQKLKIPGLKVKVLNLQQIKKIGMNALTGVAQGSVNQPRVVIFEWNYNKNKKPIVLAGKGVTFDTGGISLKPANGMEEMITDMGGSAVVVGSMINAALNKIKKPLIGIIGLVENMPDGNAQRPGDIVKSLSGQTIEVLNTDAEGRLVLADILTYVQSIYNPKEIIDFATLTGAVMVALGTHKAGLFSNDDNLAKRIFKSGERSNENVWRLPLGPEYDKDIDSSRADMQNIGIRWGGSITAAQFIQRFVENNTPWAHLDIAGVSWNKKGGMSGISKLHSSGATAFGVRLINEFLNIK